MDNILYDNGFILDELNPIAIQQKIAKKMKKMRLELGLGQQTLAKKSGVSLGSLKRFENKYEISFKHLLQLAMVLDALDEFNKLFPEKEFNSIDEILKSKKTKERKRGKND